MIRKTTKVQMRQQLRRIREQNKRNLVSGKFAKYQYGKNWLKAHAALLKETANG